MIFLPIRAPVVDGLGGNGGFPQLPLVLHKESFGQAIAEPENEQWTHSAVGRQPQTTLVLRLASSIKYVQQGALFILINKSTQGGTCEASAMVTDRREEARPGPGFHA